MPSDMSDLDKITIEPPSGKKKDDKSDEKGTLARIFETAGPEILALFSAIGARASGAKGGDLGNKVGGVLAGAKGMKQSIDEKAALAREEDRANRLLALQESEAKTRELLATMQVNKAKREEEADKITGLYNSAANAMALGDMSSFTKFTKQAISLETGVPLESIEDKFLTNIAEVPELAVLMKPPGTVEWKDVQAAGLALAPFQNTPTPTTRALEGMYLKHADASAGPTLLAEEWETFIPELGDNIYAALNGMRRDEGLKMLQMRYQFADMQDLFGQPMDKALRSLDALQVAAGTMGTDRFLPEPVLRNLLGGSSVVRPGDYELAQRAIELAASRPDMLQEDMADLLAERIVQFPGWDSADPIFVSDYLSRMTPQQATAVYAQMSATSHDSAQDALVRSLTAIRSGKEPSEADQTRAWLWFMNDGTGSATSLANLLATRGLVDPGSEDDLILGYLAGMIFNGLDMLFGRYMEGLTGEEEDDTMLRDLSNQYLQMSGFDFEAK